MVNKVTLIGHLGMDIQVHTFDNGGKIAKTTLATKESWKDKTTGERKSITTWHNLVFNGPLVDLAEKYLSKGSKVYIEGKISTRTWEKDNVKHYTTDIIVRDMTFLDTKGEAEAVKQPAYSEKEDGSYSADPQTSEPDDLPF